MHMQLSHTKTSKWGDHLTLEVKIPPCEQSEHFLQKPYQLEVNFESKTPTQGMSFC